MHTEQGVGVVCQVTNALSEADSARYEVPYAFIQHLIQAPAALEALHTSLKPLSGMALCAQKDRPPGDNTGSLAYTNTSADVVSMGSAHPAYIFLPVLSSVSCKSTCSALTHF